MGKFKEEKGAIGISPLCPVEKARAIKKRVRIVNAKKHHLLFLDYLYLNGNPYHLHAVGRGQYEVMETCMDIIGYRPGLLNLAFPGTSLSVVFFVKDHDRQ